MLLVISVIYSFIDRYFGCVFCVKVSVIRYGIVSVSCQNFVVIGLILVSCISQGLNVSVMFVNISVVNVFVLGVFVVVEDLVVVLGVLDNFCGLG